MRAFHFLAAAKIAALPASLPAAATSQRTFVASNGIDANPCSLSQPCRTFARALTQTNAGGEIVVLDSAGYGPVTIAKAVSIVAAPGAHAGITAFSGDAITVNAPDGTVVLRGLSITGQGATNGIHYIETTSSSFGGQSLLVEDCTIQGMAGAAIVATNNHFARELQAVVKRSVLRNSAAGIRLVGTDCLSSAPGCPIRVVLDDSTVLFNTAGVDYTLRDISQYVCSRQNNTFEFNALNVQPPASLAGCPAT
jgi:hypothetical protein